MRMLKKSPVLKIFNRKIILSVTMEFLDVSSNSMENKIYVEFLGSRRNNTLCNSGLLVCDQDTTLARAKLLSFERDCVHTSCSHVVRDFESEAKTRYNF